MKQTAFVAISQLEEQTSSVPEIISILLVVKCWCVTPDAIFLENLSLSGLVSQTPFQRYTVNVCLVHTILRQVTFTNLITKQNWVMKGHFSWKWLRHTYTLWQMCKFIDADKSRNCSIIIKILSFLRKTAHHTFVEVSIWKHFLLKILYQLSITS